jgi:dihydrofolate reductase
MSKTIIYISMTLDGFIAGKDDDLSWLAPYMGVDYGYKDFYDGIGAIILGKRTYDHIINNWDWPYSNVPVFVLSKDSLANKPANAEIYSVDGNIADVLTRAKAKTDKNIWIGGGAQIVQEFLNQKLADELNVTIVPQLIGGGIRLFDNIDSADTPSLIDVKQYDKGLVQLIYRL